MLTSGAEVAGNNGGFFPERHRRHAGSAHEGFSTSWNCRARRAGTGPPILGAWSQRGIVDGVVVTATLRRDARLDYLAGAGLPLSRSGDPHRVASTPGSISISRAARGWRSASWRRAAIAASRSPRRRARHQSRPPPHRQLSRCGRRTGPRYRSSADAEGAAERRGRLSRRGRAAGIARAADGDHRRLRCHGARHLPPARQIGLRPGEDLAVIALRESVARFLTPRLTCFRLSLRDLGARLGETLLATLPATAGAYAHLPRQCVWPLDLVPGESDPPLGR